MSPFMYMLPRIHVAQYATYVFALLLKFGRLRMDCRFFAWLICAYFRL